MAMAPPSASGFDPFYLATDPDEACLLAGDDTLEVQQGLVHPAFVPALAAQLDLAVDDVRSVLRFDKVLVEGRPVDRLEAPFGEGRGGVAALLRHGMDPRWVINRVPARAPPGDAAALAHAWMAKAQQTYVRCAELRAPESLLEWHQTCVFDGLEQLVRLADGEPMMWREWAPLVF